MVKNFYNRLSIIFIFSLSLLVHSKAFGLNYYWVGGPGNWSDYANHWATTSGGNAFHTQVPQSVDNVYFDAGSFTSAGQTVTIDQTIVNCEDMTWTGAANNPVLAGALANTLKVYGSLTFISGMAFSFAGPVSFEATTTGKTVTSANQVFSNTVTFNGVGGGWTLVDSLTSSSIVYLNNGTLTTNNQSVNATRFYSSTTTARTLNMGSSVFTLSNISTMWNVTNTGMTLNCGTSTINATCNSSGWNVDFYGGGQTYYNLNWTGPDLGPAGYGDINDNNTFHNVYFASPGIINSANTFNSVTFMSNGTIANNNTYNDLFFTPGYTYTLTSGVTQTINTLLSANGNCGALIAINSNTAGSTSTISHPGPGGLTVSYVTLKDIIATGVADTANNSIDLGDNSGWVIQSLQPRSLYWIANSGNWNDGSHWSLSSGGPPSGCSPTPVDSVFFDDQSFSTPGQTVTINVPVAYCNTMIWTVGVSGNPTFTGSLSDDLKIYGSLQFAAAMSFTFAGPVSFEATTTGKTVTSANQVFSNTVTFNGVGGGWTLVDSLTSNSTVYLNNGTLTTNNQSVNATRFYSSTTTARTLNMGSSVFTLSNISTMWNVTNTGMTLNCGTSTINATCNSSGWNVDFYGGGQTYYNLNWTGPDLGPAGYGDINDNNTFHNVYFASPGIINSANTFNSVTFMSNGTIANNNTYNDLFFTPGYTYTLTSGVTQTINTLLSANGNCGALIAINSNTAGSTSTISHPGPGGLTVSYVTLKDIIATGVADTANNSIDLGDNSGWVIQSLQPRSLYWIANSGNWNDGSHWSLSSGGPPSGCSPTPVDSVFFDDQSFSTPGQTVTINVPVAYCNTMIWTVGVSGNPTFTGSLSDDLKIYGSLQFAAAMSFTFAGPVSFEATTTGKTVTSANQVFSNTVTFNGVGGGWTLVDSLTSNSTVYLNNGTLTTNNQSVNATRFYSSTTTARTLNMGSSVFTLSNISTMWNVTNTGMTLNCGTSTINATCNSSGWNVDFYGGGQTYYNLNWTGPDLGPAGYGDINDNNTFHNVYFASPGIINSANTFNSVTFMSNGTIANNNTYNDLFFTPGYTYTLTSGVKQTIINALNISGTPGFPVRIQSNNVGTPSTFFKSSGTVCEDYIRLSDNTATGGATFYAGANSQDLGGNSGWIFSGGGAATVSLLSSPLGIVCPGTDVQFTANAVNAGTMPAFQWLLNGSPVGNDTDIYSNNNFTNGDIISCVMTSNAGVCAASGPDTANFTIALYPPMVLSVSSTNAGCDTTGSATVKILGGGTAPFQFLWNNGDTAQGISGLQAGSTYNVKVTDAHGCSDTAGTVINVSGGGILLSVSSTNTSCGDNNGTALAHISAGAGPFAYSWNNGDTTQNISGLAAGIYKLTVSAGGCQAMDSTVVDSSALPVSPTISTGKPIICSDDSAQICAPTGYTSYSWNTNSTLQCTEVTAAGDYYVTVTDQNNCSATSNHLSISVYPVSSVSILVQGDTLSSYGAAGYQWYDNGSPISGATSPDYIARQNGSYSVQITDSNGCHALSNDVTITGVTDLNKGTVEIYPNPSQSGSWQLSVDNSLVGSELEIYNDNGAVVLQSVIQNPKSEITLNGARGIYLLTIMAPGITINYKLIKL